MANEVEELTRRMEAGDPTAPSGIVYLAGQGDPEALYKLGEFRLRGIAGSVDPVAAYNAISSAGDAGHVKAKIAEAYMIASGLGCAADHERARNTIEALAIDDASLNAQLAFLDTVTCDTMLADAERDALSIEPKIELIRGLFSQNECAYLVELAKPELVPSMIYTRDGKGMRDPHRDSDNMVVAPMTENLVVHAFNRCIAKASGTEVGWGEPLHILRYRPSQQYRPHHDAHCKVPVQKRRLATALLYLNDDYEGGETVFPELDISVKGQTGDLLVFHNLTSDGEPDPRMLHAGNPVKSGEKWLATRWIRGSDYFGR